MTDRFRLVALVSSFREGPMLETAIRSASCLDHVFVCEGPVEGNRSQAGPESVIPDLPNVTVWKGEHETDAAKRTFLLEQAKRRFQGELWGVWLDGDEILIWGEYLRDWLWRVRQQGDPSNPVGGWPFPLVELDGSTVICMGKCVRLDLIRKYLVSSSYIELVDGSRRTVGNVEYWNPLDGPTQFVDRNGEQVPHWRARQPLQGEPHLQHRPILRSKTREVERQHKAEERNYKATVLE